MVHIIDRLISSINNTSKPFEMGSWIECIHAHLLELISMETLPSSLDYISSESRDLCSKALVLNSNEYETLTIPYNIGSENCTPQERKAFYSITRSTATLVLANLKETGRVEWPHFSTFNK